MTYQGHIQDGSVVADGQIDLPNGTPVTIVVPAAVPREELTPEELARRQAAFAEIDAIPDENPGDTFSGADHDKALYDEPYRRGTRT